MKNSLPTRKLRERPDLDQLKRQAKELLAGFAAGDAAALEEVQAHFRDANTATFALNEAQLVIARAYGFDSWTKLKAYVDGATVHRLADAVKAGDRAQARTMLRARPELVHLDMAASDEHRVLHYAVLARNPEMVRLLMKCGADARKGIYPHRVATDAYTLAAEREYDEIVAIIEEAERARHAPVPNAAEDLHELISSGNDARAIAMMEADPALIQLGDQDGWTPLHLAAAYRNERLVSWLLTHGADVNRRGPEERTPLDVASRARWWRSGAPVGFPSVATMLRRRGATLSAYSAVALGDTEWLRTRHAEGGFVNPLESWGGLLTVAVRHNRPEILRLLLDFGFDPDERLRLQDMEEIVYTWGMPLWHCARSRKYEMAEMLLSHGADPNGSVYASGTVVYAAYAERDWKMVELLERHGGVVDVSTIGHLRLTDRAQRILAGSPGTAVVEELLWSALRGGDPEIVRMSLEHVKWPRDDPRWHGMLWSALPRGETRSETDRELFIACFQEILQRCDPNVRHSREGRIVLHDVAALDELAPDVEVLSYATLLLDAGVDVNARDGMLLSTPLGWACRWGRIALVKLLLERGADAVDDKAEPWATPRAWAEKMEHEEVLALLLD